ncbi:MAG: hypothetical protein IKL84_02445, partial [Clostridia bacterium]|nr:hypothetical protein [Clostridia bacterium]
MKRTTLLPALLLIASLLFGCEAEPVDPVVTDPADTIATADPAVTTEPLAADYDLIRDGKTDYRIIRAEVLSAEAVESVTALWSFFGERGISIPVSDDWSADNRDHATVTSDSTIREILVGETNRAESRSTAAEYRGSIYGYVIRAMTAKSSSGA